MNLLKIKADTDEIDVQMFFVTKSFTAVYAFVNQGND